MSATPMRPARSSSSCRLRWQRVRPLVCGCVGVLAQVTGEVQPLPATQRTAGEVKVAAQARRIRDRVDALDSPGGPVPAARLQHPRLARIGQNERAIVARRLRIVVPRRAPLAVFLQQRRHHVQGLAGRAAALQAQADQVHPQQPDLLPRRRRPDRFIADDHAALIHAVLEAPEPERLTAQDAIGVAYLRQVTY